MNIDFITSRIKAFDYAFRGLKRLATSEPSFQVEILATLVMIGLGIGFQITRFEWIIQLLLATLMMGFEGLNTAVEELCDYVQPKPHKMIARAKDYAAGAVLLSVIATVICVIILYIPYIF